MKRQYLVPSLILGGLFLLGIGWGWQRIAPPTAYWGPDQAKEYATAQAELHSIGHSHSRDKYHEQKVAAARERFLKIHQSLEEARGSQSRTKVVFVVAGISLLVVGIVWHLAAGRPG